MPVSIRWFFIGLLNAVRSFIQRNPARFYQLDSAAQEERSWSTPINAAGYHLKAEGIYAIYPDTWRKDVCDGLNYKDVAERLVEKQLLDTEGPDRHGKTRHDKRITIHGERHRLYCVKTAILFEPEETKQTVHLFQHADE